MNKILIIGMILLALLIAGCKAPEPTPELIKSCTDNGGTVVDASCCGKDSIIPSSQTSFMNNCPNAPIGACGCGPTNSHLIKVCVCETPKCWDGTRCTSE